jgi:lysophospholipase L1-like esterase
MHPLPLRPISRRSALATLAATAATLAIAPRSFAVENTIQLDSRKTVLFLGDSITYGGTWVAWAETWFRITSRNFSTAFINLGLPSETVSGLSEPGHAGGAFPRPDLHERLGRALDATRPDLVIACYGMNDGIYYPFSEERAKSHYDGIQRLRAAVLAKGAAIVHLTPPSFDPLPLKGRTLPAGRDTYPSPYEGYDDVLAKYSEWLLARRADGWIVGDIHGPMVRHLVAQRKSKPDYTLAGDGVHPGPTGHWIMCREFLRLWGATPALLESESPDALLTSHPKGREIADLVTRRQNLLRDSWLTKVGHKRPGMAQGKPPEAIAAEVDSLLDRIRSHIG